MFCSDIPPGMSGSEVDRWLPFKFKFIPGFSVVVVGDVDFLDSVPFAVPTAVLPHVLRDLLRDVLHAVPLVDVLVVVDYLFVKYL